MQKLMALCGDHDCFAISAQALAPPQPARHTWLGHCKGMDGCQYLPFKQADATKATRIMAKTPPDEAPQCLFCLGTALMDVITCARLICVSPASRLRPDGISARPGPAMARRARRGGEGGGGGGAHDLGVAEGIMLRPLAGHGLRGRPLQACHPRRHIARRLHPPAPLWS